MKTEPKIQLSQQEMDLVNNADWILTKNGIILKVRHLLADLQRHQQDHLESLQFPLPSEILKPSSKISKGENYRGLPYLMLDYPRSFDRKDIFAIRTMFWWGNFFSLTLHLSGKHQIFFSQQIINGFDLLREKGFFVCVQEEQWEHHFEQYNYLPVGNWDKKDFEERIRNGAFIKLANKIPLKQWDQAPEILLANFQQLILVLTG
jgi:hypothetical protein